MKQLHALVSILIDQLHRRQKMNQNMHLHVPKMVQSTLIAGVVFQFFPFSCKLQLFKVATATKAHGDWRDPFNYQTLDKSVRNAAK